MKNITYGVITEKYELNGQSRISHGIAAYADAQTDGTLTVIASVHDIAYTRELAEKIAEYLNSTNLSPAQLRQTLEDLL